MGFYGFVLGYDGLVMVFDGWGKNADVFAAGGKIFGKNGKKCLTGFFLIRFLRINSAINRHAKKHKRFKFLTLIFKDLIAAKRREKRERTKEEVRRWKVEVRRRIPEQNFEW